MRVTLKVWRQQNQKTKGHFETHHMENVSPDMSFLELLDQLNETLIAELKDAVAFESDCREGICGACSLVINGIPHGPEGGTTACQLHMRSFNDGDIITVEPWRARAFPAIKDLVVDRSAFDRIQQAGGYVSVNTGAAPDGNAIPIPKRKSDAAFDYATCIGCGACVAACKNASAMLFVGAKVAHLKNMPQGEPERKDRVNKMILQMDKEGFGSCTNTLECEAACPKEISTEVIATLNSEAIRSQV